MKIAGIICEYNPFHTGHAHHIAAVRAALGDDTAVVCVMSGNFVQRGEPAIYPKHLRAECAVRGGADLVIELPVPWATATAERFAAGGISLLRSTGIVDAVAFGSECGDVSRIARVADALLLPETDALTKEYLASGITYAAARERAVRAVIGRDADVLASPNDILAVEYVKAARALGAEFDFIAVPRTGAAHDGGEADGTASASYLREKLLAGEDVSQYVAADVFKNVRPVSVSDFEQAIMYRLRTMTDGEYFALPDGEGDLIRRLMKYGRTAPTYADVLSAVKTKRYTLARIRRLVISALLLSGETAYASQPPYIRPLAFNSVGMSLLARMRKTASAAILVRPAAIKKLTGDARAVFECESRATDVYSLASGAPAGSEWTRGPVII